MTTVGPISVVKCGQSVSLCANSASDDSPNRTTWWSTSAPTKVPRWHSPARSAANTSSVRTTYVSTGKYARKVHHSALCVDWFSVAHLAPSINHVNHPRSRALVKVDSGKATRASSLSPLFPPHKEPKRNSEVNICPTQTAHKRKARRRAVVNDRVLLTPHRQVFSV